MGLPDSSSMISPSRSQISFFLLVLAAVFLSIKADSREQTRRQLESDYSQEEFDVNEVRNSRDFEYFKKILSELFAKEIPVDYSEDVAVQKNDFDFAYDPEAKNEWVRPVNSRNDQAFEVWEQNEIQNDLIDEVIENQIYDSSGTSVYSKEVFQDNRKIFLKNDTGKASVTTKDYRSKGELRSKGEKRRDRFHSHSGHEHTKRYLNEWLVHVPGGERLAQTLARDLGYDFYGQVPGFEDVYRMVKSDHFAEHHEPAHHLTRRFTRNAQVVWAEQQFAKERSKRKPHNFMGDSPEDDIRAPDVALTRIERVEEKKKAMVGVEEQDSPAENKRKNNGNTKETENTTSTVSGVTATHPDDSLTKRWIPNDPAVLNLLDHEFNDELWSQQWYLLDTRTRDSLPKLDLMVIPVWHQGLSGRGVRVLILDDGIEWTHEDLVSNYDASISYDMNDGDEDPMPSNHFGMINSHGTKCAGAVAMAANNGKCGVGVAFNARIGGIRMLDGTVTDRIEGSSLIYAKNLVDVVSCSWGPSDNGMRVEGPGTLATQALLKGIKEGRGGKGIIYVWASGNGGVMDDCSCDGYASSVYTLSIGSASESRVVPWYGESCPSTFATAYSSGAYTDQRIVSTDLGGTCTTDFTGTSAAAPLAAGIIALALEANGNVTWRDVQHAVVWTSAAGPLLRNSGWTRNGCGLLVNPHFGFGLLNATGLVSALKNWVPVSPQRTCRLRPKSRSGTSLLSGQMVELHFDGNSCAGKEEVRFLEHVQVVATLNYTYRGALSLQLLSPQGTTTQLLRERPLDESNQGFNSWPFMTVHTWGEDPRGKWTLTVNVKKTRLNQIKGKIGKVFLVLYGTQEAPPHMMDRNNQPGSDYAEVSQYHDYTEDDTTTTQLWESQKSSGTPPQTTSFSAAFQDFIAHILGR